MSKQHEVDTILIEDLQIQCIIGIYDWERELPQTVNLSLEIPTDTRNAAASDNIQDALDYKAISKAIAALIADSSFNLLEKLAEEIAQMCLRDFDLPWIRLRLDKPGALRGARTVGLQILRSKI